METYISNSVFDTENFGKNIASKLKPDSFIALYGDLGVGKTAFVRGLCSILSPGSHVFSPTYTIVNEYIGQNLSLFHFDLYRIGSDDDLYSCGFYDYLGSGICVCEWCENIPWAIPENAIRITIEKIADEDGCFGDKRKITVRGTI